MFFDERVFELNVDAKNEKDVITDLANTLRKKDIVKDNFLEHVLQREQKFPTGLPIRDGLGIAMPHTDSKYVNKSQIAIASLKHPVIFKNMVDASKKVEVSLVFMIAMSKPHEQPNLLSNLMNMCQSPHAVKDLISSRNGQQIYTILKEFNLS